MGIHELKPGKELVAPNPKMTGHLASVSHDTTFIEGRAAKNPAGKNAAQPTPGTRYKSDKDKNGPDHDTY